MQLAPILFASFLMIVAGCTKKRLIVKAPRCAVCRRERKSCTCRWL